MSREDVHAREPRERAKSVRSRRYRQYATIFVLLGACIVVGRGAWGMWATFTRAQTEAAIAQKELERVSARNDRVLAEIAQLDDPRGREAELRHRFDVGRPGEKLLVVIEEQHPEIVEVEPITWYDRIKASLPLWAKW